MSTTLRALHRNEMPIVIEMAAREGWNPGLQDGVAFYAADPGGFLVAESAGRVLGCISAVAYGTTLGFIGLFIVAPDLRGQGLGGLLWDAGMTRLSGRVVGLDGVPAQQDYYRRKGFELAWQNVRFAGVVRHSSVAVDERIVPLGGIDFASVCADDLRVFSAPRESFLRAWIDMPGAPGLAWVERGRVAGWGVVRPCREGYKIGPLVADNADIATALYAALSQQAQPGSALYLDVPVPNLNALKLAEQQGMHRAFETARMYRGAVPAVAIERVYGITSFELG
jgi:predicted N-acetyltransferase YhbS